ncbi:EcsC family protein [Megasphaera elsdenii]|uniref:EcsC family protein n=1 Tax=Megasphaera elsdenii TaxID=907 RepID=UPI00242DDEC7|nr:EcsC family protein [Megasphaera elsdenii]
MVKILDISYDKALNGVAGMKGAADLATDYMAHGGDLEAQVDALIKNQIIKCGTSGFLTSLGGFITLPVALPANVASVIYMQMQMIAAIARMGGYDLHDDRVKTLIIACLCGNEVKEILKQAGIQIGKKLTERAVQKISSALIVRINRAVGFRLLTKFGTKGAINLSKAIPVIGGFIGGGVDAYSTKVIGNKAKELFILGQNESPIVTIDATVE